MPETNIAKQRTTADERHERFVEENREWNEKVEDAIDRMKEVVREEDTERRR